IRMVAQQILSGYTSPSSEIERRPSLTRGDWDSLERRLRNVRQYGDGRVRMSLQAVPLKAFMSLTRYVREYKYRQVDHLAAFYRQIGLDLFTVAHVRFFDGQESIVTPPVVE